MNFLKISFISIIIIPIFQSQLYGIKLDCHFKPKITKRYFNNIICSDTLKDVTDTKNVYDVCELNEPTRPIDKLSMYDGKEVWISQRHPSFMIKHWKNNGKKIPKPPNDIYFKVINVVNHLKEYEDEYFRGEDSYLFTLKNDIYGIYILYFDSISKKSILTSYHSGVSGEKKDINYFKIDFPLN